MYNKINLLLLLKSAANYNLQLVTACAGEQNYYGCAYKNWNLKIKIIIININIFTIAINKSNFSTSLKELISCGPLQCISSSCAHQSIVRSGAITVQ